MRAAINSFENLKTDKEHLIDMRESNAILETEVKSLKSENKELRSTIKENIQDELSLLQAAILNAEHQMKTLQEENFCLRQNLNLKDRVLQELDLEHQSLIKRLQISEDETLSLSRRLGSLEEDINSSMNKDSRIKQLEYDLEKALEEKELVLKETLNQYFKNFDNNKNEQEELINSLVHDNKKYIELIQTKDNTIVQLREEFANLANEFEKRINENADSGNIKINKSAENAITEELFNIRENIAASHHELIDKIVDLHKELKSLKNENHVLQKEVASKSQQPELVKKNNELGEQNEQLKNENSMLRDTLNTPYPGLVENILAHGKEVKRLQDENELLRLALSTDRKELVDSNLRKKKKIKELESELQDLQLFSPNNSFKSRRRSSSQGEMPEMLRYDVPLVDVAPNSIEKLKYLGQYPDDKRGIRDQKQLLKEIAKQNQTIKKLRRENEKFKDKHNSSKAKEREINALKCERDQLKMSNKSNKALEEELFSLRNAFKHLNEGSDLVGKKEITELENQVQLLKEQLASTTDHETALSPSRSKLKLGPFEASNQKQLLTDVMCENVHLKRSLQKANSDIGRLANIIERNKHNSSAEQFQLEKIKKLEGRVRKLKEENNAFRKNSDTLQRENDNASTELSHLKNSLLKADSDKLKANQEAIKLREIINDLDKHEGNKEENNGLNIMVKVLTESVEELQDHRNELEKKLKAAETKSLRLETQIRNNATNDTSVNEKLKALESDRHVLEQDLFSANVELSKMREERNVLEEKNKNLCEELGGITNDITETRIAEWLENDADRRLALLSPDIHHIDAPLDTDRRTKRDHSRLFRKLQVENQTLRGKLSNLADESVDTTKIIADLERGHGHLTGTLRCYLILQKASSGKLLEGSLQQYTSDFDALQRKFSLLEMKYDKEKKFSKRRDHAWELFANASATISNIHTILDEGLVKVEEDLEKDLTDEDFENKDYKSRLWILRRRLSDVENRHRELQLRTEELSIRLDARTTEFEVTQDELEDTTRDLEARDTSIHSLRSEVKKLTIENMALSDLIRSLEQNQDETVGDVMSENDMLRNTTVELNQQYGKDIKAIEADLNETIEKLDEKDAALNIMRKLRDDSEKNLAELRNKVTYLERRLKTMTEQRDTLKKEAENRAAYMPNVHDDHGTIHMLRDDIKKLAKENADLKQDIILKQRQTYSMSKDLYNLRTKGSKTTTKQDESGIVENSYNVRNSHESRPFAW